MKRGKYTTVRHVELTYIKKLVILLRCMETLKTGPTVVALRLSIMKMTKTASILTMTIIMTPKIILMTLKMIQQILV